MLTKLCSRKGYTSIAVKGMAKEQLRRLTDPDGLQEKYMTTPKEMMSSDSKIRIYDQEDINLVQDMLRDFKVQGSRLYFKKQHFFFLRNSKVGI